MTVNNVSNGHREVIRLLLSDDQSQQLRKLNPAAPLFVLAGRTTHPGDSSTLTIYLIPCNSMDQVNKAADVARGVLGTRKKTKPKASREGSDNK